MSTSSNLQAATAAPDTLTLGDITLYGMFIGWEQAPAGQRMFGFRQAGDRHQPERIVHLALDRTTRIQVMRKVEGRKRSLMGSRR